MSIYYLNFDGQNFPERCNHERGLTIVNIMAKSVGKVHHASDRYLKSDNIGLKYTNKYACPRGFRLHIFFNLYIIFYHWQIGSLVCIFCEPWTDCVDNSASIWIHSVNIKCRRCIRVAGFSLKQAFIWNYFMGQG